MRYSTSFLFFFPSHRTLTYVSLKTTLNVPIPGYFTSYHISVDSIQDAGKYIQGIPICSELAIVNILSEMGNKEAMVILKYKRKV